MNETFIVEKTKVKVKNPVLLAGLPGIGLIGQVICKYLIHKMNGKKIAEIYSPYFPHQVIMTRRGGIRPIKNIIYQIKMEKNDLLLIVGDLQAISSEGQYDVVGKILDYAQKLGVKKVISLGGYSTGKFSEKRKVFAVVTNKELIRVMQKVGAIVGEAKGAIVGIAGLLPAFAKIRGMYGVCIMGETHGNYVDVASARNVINVLEKLLDFTVDLSDLEKQAKEGEKIIKKIDEEMQKQMVMPYQEDDKKNISYIR